MNRKIFVTMLAAASGCAAATAHAANFGGVDATPTAYEVTLTKVEFIDSVGTAVTFAEGSYTFDIASASAVGSFASGSTLPPGSYVSIRYTLSRTFGLSGASADAGAGQPCRTDSGNGSAGTLLGGALQMTRPAAFTIPEGATVMPGIRIDFDVLNGMEVLTTGAGTCAVMPQPPVVTFTLG